MHFTIAFEVDAISLQLTGRNRASSRRSAFLTGQPSTTVRYHPKGSTSGTLSRFEYRMELQTDTEVVAYLFDLLVRRHNLPIELAAKVLASPFCEDIDMMPDRERRIATALRQVYGGVKYILIERAPYIGGQMIGRSKTFPTLDCSQFIFM